MTLLRHLLSMIEKWVTCSIKQFSIIDRCDIKKKKLKQVSRKWTKSALKPQNNSNLFEKKKKCKDKIALSKTNQIFYEM